nr:lytic polysaccharide monooxygenase [Natrarchaeobius chitinivorans]
MTTETTIDRTDENNRAPRVTRSRVAKIGLIVFFVMVLGIFAVQMAAGHGSMEDPPSQTYYCNFIDDGDNEMCQYAYEENPQSVYDWHEINIADADSNHQELIDDGELCSASRDKYDAFNEPGDWPTTEIEPGEQTLTYEASAPHETEYFQIHITEDGWNPDTRLAWDDLELIHETDPFSPDRTITIDGVDVPERNGEHVIYTIWQRSDSPEAFYSCSYVDFDGDGPDNGDDPDHDVWDSDETYTSGDKVVHDGAVWEANWWTQGDEPGSSEWGPWEHVEDVDDDDNGNDDDSPDADE